MTEPPRARSFGHSDRNFNSSLRIRIPTDPDPDPASTPARPPTSGSGCSPRARCKLLGFSRWFCNCGQKLASFFASEEQRVVRILIRSMTQAGLAPSPWCALVDLEELWRLPSGRAVHQPVDRGRDAVRCAARLEVRVLSSSIELCKSDELAQAETPLRSPSNPPNSVQTRRPYVPRPRVPNRTPAIVCCRSSARSEQRARALFGATIGPSARPAHH